MNTSIDTDMRQEAEDFSKHLQTSLSSSRTRKEISFKEVPHPNLTTEAMNRTMIFRPALIDRSPEIPRDFFNKTNNEETKQVFGKSLSTEAYRSQYAGMQDPLAITKVKNANDLAYRNMHVNHERELLNASYENKPSIQIQHKFEKSYFEFEEAKFNKSPDIEQKFKQAHASFKEWSGLKHGIDPDTTIKTQVERTIIPPALTREDLAKVEKPALAPAPHQVTKEESVSRIQSLRAKHTMKI